VPTRLERVAVLLGDELSVAGGEQLGGVHADRSTAS
jgi:hypothetical protein